MNFEAGQAVTHKVFGNGIVRRVEDEKVTIKFDNHDFMKTINENFLTEQPARVPTTTTVPALVTDPIVVFDAAESTVQKEVGIARAVSTRKELLVLAQKVAREVALAEGTVHMDKVSEGLEKLGFTPTHLGNAAGAVFRGSQWTFTRKLHESERVERHSGVQKIWVLSGQAA